MTHNRNVLIALFWGFAWLTILASQSQASSCASGVRFVTVELIDSTLVASDTARREHVFVSEDLMDMLGIDDDFASGERVNPQIHVEIEDPVIDGRKSSAVFTVAGVIDNFPIRHIRVYRKRSPDDKNSGEYKLFQDVANDDVDLSVTYGNGGVFGVDARVNSIAVSQSRITNTAGSTITRDFFCQPPENDSKGFTERAILSTDTRVAVVAPHGGGVEAPTDEQADELAQELDTSYGIDPSLWWTDGSWDRGQTFQRWHTTATAIDPTSFPGLAQLFRLPDDATNRPFRYSVALHGYDSSDVGLILGGRADRLDQCLVAKRIQEALVAAGRDAHDIGLRIHSVGHSDLTVANDDGKIPPDEHAGHLADNLVNRLSPNPSSLSGFGGLQLEQSSSLRSNQVLLDSVTQGLAEALDELVSFGTPADHCSSLN